MDKIDIVYYINLDHRTDRNEEFLEWIGESGFPSTKVQRIQAIYLPEMTHAGCSMSHIKTLEIFLESPFSNCIVFEDDYIPLTVGKFWKHFENLFEYELPFDLVLCSYNELKSEEIGIPFLRKVHGSLTTSGYMITRNFARILLEHWKEGLRLFTEEYKAGRNPFDYMLDTYWQKLMPSHNCLTFYPRIGIQRPSYSDLQQKNTNYRV